MVCGDPRTRIDLSFWGAMHGRTVKVVQSEHREQIISTSVRLYHLPRYSCRSTLTVVPLWKVASWAQFRKFAELSFPTPRTPPTLCGDKASTATSIQLWQ